MAFTNRLVITLAAVLLSGCHLCPKTSLDTTTATALQAVNVKHFGAIGDGIHDDTAAIQKALDYAGAHLPNCYLPAGLYRLNRTLTIPAGVTLTGANGSVNHCKTPNGSTLLIYGGKGDENGPPAIILDWSATIRQLTIHYPEQLPPPDIIPYPWTIQGRGQLCQVIDVVLTNPYKAIDFGSYHNELHLVRNVFACPLNVGIYVDQCTDVGRIENVHFNPNFWKRSALSPRFPTGDLTENDDIEGYQNKLIGEYLMNHLVGFKIGKTDWQYMTNCFVIFAKEGFLFDDFGHGTGNALVTQSGADVGPVAVNIRKSQGHAGIQFVNCQFMATVRIGPDNRGTIKISNSGFWPIREIPTREQIIKEGPGSLILNSCHFANWDVEKEGTPCVRASGGRVSIGGCEFMAPKTAILFESGLIGATVYGSLFGSETPILNHSGTAIETGFNVTE